MAKRNIPTLILKLKVAGEPRSDVRAVTRIKLDGEGHLLYWDAETGEASEVEVAALESVVIHPLAWISKAA